ncbi:ANTAR domain-containing protein [Nonomuraea gerenzanensis]|uniref:ANTAR domain-containing protein n=1 Tax=Nonomuraea gerenzanensis TaxID=93944 RepID=A0A1M4ECG4_9ACTN|nr:ANTAR domain-containing protein [Nonomuraea gerenzanensis]UBU18439.1 ANTAR domain-containing protein [Nonomuraea gerenzanensis]SBO96273.1 hypothetical protein BN4615_P5789 [Nonomuraea gerenzanensis]
MLHEHEIRTAAALLAALAPPDGDHPLSRQALQLADHLRSVAAHAAHLPSPPADASVPDGVLTGPACTDLARRAAARAALAAQMRERAAENARRAASALATLRARQTSLVARGWLPGTDGAVLDRSEAARWRYDARQHTLINRAVGILMAQHRCTTARALQTLHARARRQGCDLAQAAAELISSVSGEPPPSPAGATDSRTAHTGSGPSATRGPPGRSAGSSRTRWSARA